jgi:hypothetical protein
MIVKRWRKLTPLFIFVILAICLAVAAVASETRALGNWLVLIALGLLIWSLGEYIMHRVLFHFEAKWTTLLSLKVMHLGHHDDPQSVDQLFISPWVCLPTAIGYCLLAWLIFGNWHSVTFLFIGALIGYSSYEWLHYQAHHGHSRLRLLRYLKKYHLLHHGETPNLRFGVTSPLFDYFFGTFQSVNDHH